MANNLNSLLNGAAVALGGAPKAGKRNTMPGLGAPGPGIQDMLSRPKRPHRKGYTKTSATPAATPAVPGVPKI